MNNDENRARRLGSAGTRSPTPNTPGHVPAPGRRMRTAAPAPWTTLVDGRVRDSPIRKDLLTVVTLVLALAAANSAPLALDHQPLRQQLEAGAGVARREPGRPRLRDAER